MSGSGLRRGRFADNPWDSIQPNLSSWIHIERLNERMIGTLAGYVTYVRRFSSFCIKFKYNIMTVPYPAPFMMYWLGHEVRHYRNAQSMRSWESAIKWLGSCLGDQGVNAWYRESRYQALRKRIIREYVVPPCEKFPFLMRHLAAYTRYKAVISGNYMTVPYDALLEVLWLQLLFMTMSRPCELLNRPCDKHKLGLRYRDCQHVTIYGQRFFRISVWHYKNQRARRVPKELTISPSTCHRDNCMCRIINPYALLVAILKRRKRMQPFLWSASQKKALAIKPDALLFIRFSGMEMKTTNTAPIIADMARVSRVLEPQFYSEYSLRVGGATHCSAAGIPDALMYRYVGWDPSKLPDVAKRYQRPPLEMRLQMQNYMLHGFVDHNGRHNDVRLIPGMIHDPWANGSPSRWHGN